MSEHVQGAIENRDHHAALRTQSEAAEDQDFARQEEYTYRIYTYGSSCKFYIIPVNLYVVLTKFRQL